MALVQLVAAAEAGVALRYYCNGDVAFLDEFQHLVSDLRSAGTSVGDLFGVMCRFLVEGKHEEGKSIFKFVRRRLIEA